MSNEGNRLKFEAGQRSNEGDVSTPLFITNGAKTQPLDRFKQILCQKLQVSVLLRTSKLNFEKFASKRSCVQIKNFRIICFVVVNRNLDLGTIVEA